MPKENETKQTKSKGKVVIEKDIAFTIIEKGKDVLVERDGNQIIKAGSLEEAKNAIYKFCYG